MVFGKNKFYETTTEHKKREPNAYFIVYPITMMRAMIYHIAWFSALQFLYSKQLLIRSFGYTVVHLYVVALMSDYTVTLHKEAIYDKNLL